MIRTPHWHWWTFTCAADARKPPLAGGPLVLDDPFVEEDVDRTAAVVRLAEQERAEADGVAVPRGDDFVIQSRRHALLARLVQKRSHPSHRVLEFIRRQIQLTRDLGADGFVVFNLSEKLATEFLPPLHLK